MQKSISDIVFHTYLDNLSSEEFFRWINKLENRKVSGFSITHGNLIKEKNNIDKKYNLYHVKICIGSGIVKEYFFIFKIRMYEKGFMNYRLLARTMFDSYTDCEIKFNGNEIYINGKNEEGKMKKLFFLCI